MTVVVAILAVGWALATIGRPAFDQWRRRRAELQRVGGRIVVDRDTARALTTALNDPQRPRLHLTRGQVETIRRGTRPDPSPTPNHRKRASTS